MLYINYLLKQIKPDEDGNGRILTQIINGVLNKEVYRTILSSENFKIENLNPKTINYVIDRFTDIEEPNSYQIRLLIRILENNKLAISANKLLSFLMVKNKMFNNLRNRNEDCLIRLIRLLATAPEGTSSLNQLTQLYQLASRLSQQNYQSNQLANFLSSMYESFMAKNAQYKINIE